MEPTTVENKEEVETIEFRDAHQETRLCETSEEILKLEIKEQKEQKENKEKELSKIEEVLIEELSSPPELDKQKLKELVLTEISLEKQLESVQKQLLALKYLPSKIENHLSIVSEQLHRIMELSGKQYGSEGICFQRFKGKIVIKIHILSTKYFLLLLYLSWHLHWMTKGAYTIVQGCLPI